MLVVLDDCEHLLDACAALIDALLVACPALIDALLVACPALALLAASREPIGVAGEVTWRVPSRTLADQAIDLFTDVPAGLSVDALVDSHQCPLID
jgi:predicted ATPase